MHEHVPAFAHEHCFDPGTNALAGAWYLHKLLLRYARADHPAPFALADYNAGRGNLLKWNHGAAATNSAVFIEQIGFPGTKHYVQSVLQRYKHYRLVFPRNGNRDPSQRFGLGLDRMAVSEQSQSSQLLTNDVPIGTGGMRLIITDNDDATSTQEISSQLELSADKDAHWVLHNSSSNFWQSVVFKGMNNSFAFELRTTNGISIPKSAKGKAMSVGSKSLTNIYAGRTVRIGEGMQDFPKLTEVFNFPSNGVYILEVRYWSWNSTKQKFELTEPVRLKVIKQDNRTSPVSINATNTSIPRQ